MENIKIKSLGPVKDADINFGNLTIVWEIKNHFLPDLILKINKIVF
jgi:hypothetical protein